MKTRIGLPACVEFDDSAHFPAVLRGVSCGIDADGVQFVRLNLRAEAWRAIVSKRNAVDHKLGLIFRTARMQNGVAFVDPSGLGVDQVLDGTAGQRREALLNLLRSDLRNRGWAVRVYQGAHARYI